MIKAFYSETGERSAARSLLAHAVRALYGIPCPELEKGPHGKPFFPSRPDIHFSLSHTKTHVLVCVSDLPCGCDVETVRPLRPSVVKTVCSPEELEQFNFFELWTLKESFFKLHGSLPHPFWETRFRRTDAGTIVPPSSPSQALLNAAVYDLGSSVAALCSPLPLPAALTPISLDALK